MLLEIAIATHIVLGAGQCATFKDEEHKTVEICTAQHALAPGHICTAEDMAIYPECKWPICHWMKCRKNPARESEIGATVRHEGSMDLGWRTMDENEIQRLKAEGV